MLKTVGNLSTRYGDQTIVNGNLVIGTAGKGIDFSAGSSAPGMTSELLDDYEEGTFTATLTSATPPTTPPTTTGYYTKIGDVVNVRLYFDSVNTTGGSGVMSVTGLPFTSKTLGNPGRTVGAVLTFNLPVPNKYNLAFLTSNSTTLTFLSVADGAAWASVDIDSGPSKVLAVNITYSTAS